LQGLDLEVDVEVRPMKVADAAALYAEAVL
jgi:hypothetical protein